jgi:hypothetical protein
MLEMLKLFAERYSGYRPVEARRTSLEFNVWEIVTMDENGNRAKFCWNQISKRFYRPYA